LRTPGLFKKKEKIEKEPQETDHHCVAGEKVLGGNGSEKDAKKKGPFKTESETLYLEDHRENFKNRLEKVKGKGGWVGVIVAAAKKTNFSQGKTLENSRTKKKPCRGSTKKKNNWGKTTLGAKEGGKWSP